MASTSKKLSLDLLCLFAILLIHVPRGETYQHQTRRSKSRNPLVSLLDNDETLSKELKTLESYESHHRLNVPHEHKKHDQSYERYQEKDHYNRNSKNKILNDRKSRHQSRNSIFDKLEPFLSHRNLLMLKELLGGDSLNSGEYRHNDNRHSDRYNSKHHNHQHHSEHHQQKRKRHNQLSSLDQVDHPALRYRSDDRDRKYDDRNQRNDDRFQRYEDRYQKNGDRYQKYDYRYQDRKDLEHRQFNYNQKYRNNDLNNRYRYKDQNNRYRDNELSNRYRDSELNNRYRVDDYDKRNHDVNDRQRQQYSQGRYRGYDYRANGQDRSGKHRYFYNRNRSYNNLRARLEEQSQRGREQDRQSQSQDKRLQDQKYQNRVRSLRARLSKNLQNLERSPVKSLLRAADTLDCAAQLQCIQQCVQTTKKPEENNNNNECETTCEEEIQCEEEEGEKEYEDLCNESGHDSCEGGGTGSTKGPIWDDEKDDGC